MEDNTNSLDQTFEQLQKELQEIKHSFALLKTASEKTSSEYSHAIFSLQEREKSSRNLFYNAPVNYNSLDSGGYIIDVNPAWLNSLGYLHEEVSGHHFSEFITPEAYNLYIEQWLPELLESGQIHDIEFEMIRKDGNRLFVSLDGKAGTNNKGESPQIHFIWSDITRRKNAEKLQLENENSYRELFDNVTDAIYIQDEEGVFLDVNEGAVRMYGYPKEMLIGKTPLFVSAPGKNDHDAIAALTKRAYEGEPQHFEFWGQRANGEIFPKEVRVVNGTYFGKKVNIAMAQIITERKQAEIALQESERRFRDLIDFAVDGILIGANDGIIIAANTYMQNLTGRSVDELIGHNISELFGNNDLIEDPLRYDLLKKSETIVRERNIHRSDGKFIPIEMHTKMMPDGTYQSIYRDVTERKRSEEILRESETKFKSLVESTSDLIWETSTEGNYTYVSPQFETLLGYTAEEVIGKSPYHFMEGHNGPEEISESGSIVNPATPFNFLVNKFKHRNGNILYFETSGVPVYDNSGKLTGYRGVSRDITRRRSDEKELHKLSSVVQQNPNTIIITNLEGTIEYINPAGCSITGYTAAELIGKKPSIFSSGDTSQETYRNLWKTIIAGKKWEGTFKNRKKTGEYFWESTLIVPIRDAEGIITHYLAVKEDITKRIVAEEALVESEERYRRLFDASPDAIILADIESGILVGANSAACSMLGYELNEIRQMHQSEIHPARLKQFVIDAFNEHARIGVNNGNMQPIESVCLRSDGVELPVEVLSNNITLNGRNIMQGVFRNISERNQVREELLKAKEKAEASDKLKSAFLRNISHELRTPLNGIIGFSEMITRTDSSEEERIEFNRMIKKSSARLINTITGYMDISLIVSGLTEVNKQPFSIRKFLDKITTQTIELCYSRNLHLDVICLAPDEDLEINTDEFLLIKIFRHFIDNAAKFTTEGSITIGYELKSGFHQFSVSDTGTGIPKEFLTVIFDIFRQIDLSASRVYEGSGLGLSIAKGFVKLLGGEIKVESEINQGTTFSFTIPAEGVVADDSTETCQSLQPILPVALVAEDDDSNYKYLEIVLKKASFKVLRAKNGFETVDICRSHPDLSVLITDMKMPGMDGLESTRLIRTILPDLPIIALSGLISSMDEEAARQAGCNDYIIKPVSKAKLLETIYKLMYPTI